MDQLYNYGGLSALAASMTRAFGELHHLELNLLMMSEEKPSHRRARSVPAIHLSNESLEEEGVTMVSTHKESFPINMMGPPATVFALENKPSTFLPTQITSAREPLLDKIRVARNRLKQSTKYVDVVAAQALMFEGDEAESLIGEEDRLAEMTRSQRISSFLNLCSTFLYMTNYYIVAPTCGQYALLLGSTEAMAGIIIGMTPNAALIATVLYGWWSNFSYKSALIFAASSSLVGNVFVCVGAET